MNYYLVTTKCGHVGKNFYIPITFPVKAESGKEAARIARQFPRVKHHHWDAILNCKRVSRKAYEKQMRINDNDEYLKCRSKKEQKQKPNMVQERMIEDNHQKELMMKNKKSSRPNLKFQIKKYNCYSDDFDYIEFSIGY